MDKRTMILVKNVVTIEHSDNISEDELMELAHEEVGGDKPIIKGKDIEGNEIKGESETNEIEITRSESITDV